MTFIWIHTNVWKELTTALIAAGKNQPSSSEKGTFAGEYWFHMSLCRWNPYENYYICLKSREKKQQRLNQCGIPFTLWIGSRISLFFLETDSCTFLLYSRLCLNFFLTNFFLKNISRHKILEQQVDKYTLWFKLLDTIQLIFWLSKYFTWYFVALITIKIT